GLVGCLALAEGYFDRLRLDNNPLDVTLDQLSISELILVFEGFPVPEMIAHAPDDDALDVRRRQAGHPAGLLWPGLKEGVRDIIAVAHASLVGVRRAHAGAAIVEQTAPPDRRPAPEPHPP